MLSSIIIFLIACGLYVLPMIVALCKKKKNAGAIIVLNIAAGWTFIGWFVALIWALCEDD